MKMVTYWLFRDYLDHYYTDKYMLTFFKMILMESDTLMLLTYILSTTK